MKDITEDKDALKSMILVFIMNRGLITDRQLLDSLNSFTQINPLTLQALLREMAVEHKLILHSYKVPLKQGQFGTFMVVGVPNTQQSE